MPTIYRVIILDNIADAIYTLSTRCEQIFQNATSVLGYQCWVTAPGYGISGWGGVILMPPATHRFGKVRYPNSAASVGTFFRQCRHVSKCRHCRPDLSASVGMSAETVGKMADTSCVEFVSHIRSAEKTQRMPTLPTIVGKNLPTLPTCRADTTDTADKCRANLPTLTTCRPF